MKATHDSTQPFEQLGKLVRKTAVFRAAAACSRFAGEARELRENDSLAYSRLVDETHRNQDTNVSSRTTTLGIIEAFLDVIEDYGELADEEAETIAENAAREALEEDGDI